MELGNRRTQLLQTFFGLGDHHRIEAVGLFTEVFQHRRNDFGRGVKEIHAAFLQLRQIFRFEHHGPAVSRCGIAEHFLDLGDVVADAGSAPQVIDRVRVVRIKLGDVGLDGGIHVGQIRNLGLVQRHEHASLDLPGQEGQRRHHHIVAGVAGHQFGLQHFVAVEHVVGHLDAGFLFEVGEGFRRDVIGPVVDVQDFLFFSRSDRSGVAVLLAAGSKNQCGNRNAQQFQFHDSTLSIEV